MDKVTDKLLEAVIEELKQRVVTTSAKLRRYEARTEQYAQTGMFLTNQAKLFDWKRMEKNRSNVIIPGIQQSVKFWNEIWDLPVRHNNKAHWLKKVETQPKGAKKQENITKNLKKQLQREKN